MRFLLANLYPLRSKTLWIASHKGPCAVTTSTPKRPPARPLRLSLDDPRIAGLFWQILVVGIAIAIVAWLWSNAVHNLSVRRISTGFAFLGREAGMPISDAWID